MSWFERRAAGGSPGPRRPLNWAVRPVLASALAIAGLAPAGAAAAAPSGWELPRLPQPSAIAVSPVKNGHSPALSRPDQTALALAKEAASHKPASRGLPAEQDSAELAPGPGRTPRSFPVTLVSLAARAPHAPAGRAADRRVQVTLADRGAARRSGVQGLLFSMAGTASAPGRATVRVDYAALRASYGPDWAARLRLVQLPACALTTPAAPRCRVRTPLPTVNDIKTGTLTATAPVPAAAAGSAPARALLAADAATVLAAEAGSSGANGDYKATSLQASGSWSAGSSSGGFNWTYPLAFPAVPAGAAPKLSLGYSSQSVDGRTSASNNQPGWVGDGWSMEPGFIERRYRSCNDDMTGGTNKEKSGDQCWFTDNATLSLGGRTTELAYEQGKGWHAQSDNGDRIEKLTGASNGDDDGEYWKVTATDGTQYFFGLNHLPGWTAGKPATQSAWTVPVYGNHSGEPCYKASFAAGWCQQAWRWQLDHVVDPHGNAQAYYWNAETNNYDRGAVASADKGTPTPYTRGGWLDHVDYGLRKDTVYSAPAMAQVKFDVADRCTADCTLFDKDHSDNWPDVPVDRNCADGATKCEGQYSPTFWSKKRLTTITSKVLTGGTYKDVDSWALEQTFPPTGDGTARPLWLSTIQRTGRTNGSITLPKVTFLGQQLANRVDKTGDGLAPFIRYRVYQIDTDTGGSIGITYSAPGCTATTLPPADATNTTTCYPVKWAFEGETAKLDWFNKYLVTEVDEGDNLAETPDVVTRYSFLDGAAWAKSDDEFTKADDRTYSEFRGYGRVQVRKGDGLDRRSLAESRYFRGIDGAEVADSTGATVTDRPEFAGQVRESVEYDGDGGPWVKASSNVPWRSGVTATRQRDGLPALEARFGGVEKETTRVRTATGERKASTTRTFDDVGMEATSTDSGDESKTGDEKCTRTDYARNTGLNLMDKVARVETVAVGCEAAVSRPADVISDTRNVYDGGAFGDAPTQGDVTRTEVINPDGNGYSAKGSTAYDLYGRQTAVTDPYGKSTRTAYTPPTGEVATKTVVTDPLDFVATTTFDPLRALPVVQEDLNKKVSTTQYDALGRVTKVWLPGRAAATYPDSPHLSYSYLVRTDGPVVVTSSTLSENGGYLTKYEFMDGLLRSRQIQEPSPGGGRLVTESFFNTLGQNWKNSGKFYATGAPSDVLVTGAELSYPASTETQYDGAGRTTAVISKKFGDEQSRTTTVDEGDRTTVIPPKGGTARTTLTDNQGRTVETREYTNAARTAYQSTRYGYDRLGRLAKVTDAAGRNWTYGYDVRGRKTSVTDPDTGTTTLTYDIGDRETDTKNALGTVHHTDYDALGRKVAVKVNGVLTTEYVFDTIAKGKQTAAKHYVNGQAYVSEVTWYNNRYQATASQLTVPATEGALAGVYKWTAGFNANTGKPEYSDEPAVGGLPKERVGTRYDADGLPFATTVGGAMLAGATTYDHYGRVLRTELGEVGKKVWQSNEYDQHTGNLTRTVTDRETAPQRLDDTRYGFDPAGNITKVTTASGQDAQLSTDTQCFGTDGLRRITEAWTATDGCAAAPSGTTVGGPDAYWTSYTYDAIGNRRSEVQHKAPGGPATDVTRSYGTPVTGSRLPSVTTTGGPDDGKTENYTYDDTGNTVRRQLPAGDQKLDWDKEGHLAKVTEGTKTTSYLYDSEGQRLIRKDASGTTLTLPGGTELLLKPDNTTLVGTRYYSHNGSTVAVRTGAKLSFVLSDHHGTGTIQVDSATHAVTKRRTTPFGAARGQQPTGWTGDRGFVGGTRDASTGLTHLGAREYDPATGRFVSADPVMDLSDTQQINGYAYAHNNPLASSDPTGLYDPDLRDYCTKNKDACDGDKPKDDTPDPDPVEDYVDEALEEAFGDYSPLAQRVSFSVGAGEDRGIIMVRFYIHTPDAALGMLVGDNRGVSKNPNAPYRMTLFWDTSTGQCTFTVAESQTPPSVKYPWRQAGRNPVPDYDHPTQVPGETIPARPIEVDAQSSDTLLGYNVVNLHTKLPYSDNSVSPEKLDIGIHGVNSRLRLFAVDNRLTVEATKTDVRIRREGDAYPDMEVFQYRRGMEPRLIAQDSMASTTGLDSAPGLAWRRVDRTWVSGKCVSGC
ncbi:RHS repeat-associated core domain-containing protein [Streptomyces sp. NPDC089919]|uniref:RHS repeat-associated core domain-containing protein n=1 Tax=Streptomyces sp. NPDC089919 TaxID=3155188 RepID=UPI003424B5DC